MNLEKYNSEFIYKKLDEKEVSVRAQQLKKFSITNEDDIDRLVELIKETIQNEGLNYISMDSYFRSDEEFINFTSLILSIMNDDQELAEYIIATCYLNRKDILLNIHLVKEFIGKYKENVIKHFNYMREHEKVFGYDILNNKYYIKYYCHRFRYDKFMHRYKMVALIEEDIIDLGIYKNEILDDLYNGVFNEKISFFTSLFNETDNVASLLGELDTLTYFISLMPDERNNWKEYLIMQLVKSIINITSENEINKYLYDSLEPNLLLDIFNITRQRIITPRVGGYTRINLLQEDDDLEKIKDDILKLLNEDPIYSRFKILINDKNEIFNGTLISKVIIQNDVILKLMTDEECYKVYSEGLSGYYFLTFGKSGVLRGSQLKYFLDVIYKDLGMNPRILIKEIKSKKYRENIL